MSRLRFAPGQIVSTPGALKAMLEAGQEPASFLLRHLSGDWGEVDRHDAAENEFALEQQLRIIAHYVGIPAEHARDDLGYHRG